MSLFTIKDYMREDIKLAGLAIFFGFRVTCKKYGDPYQFELSNYSIWKIRDGWQTARFVNDVYVDHKKFSNLSDALEYVYKLVNE